MSKDKGRDVLTAPKELTARFLKRLGDCFGKKLLEFDQAGMSVTAKDRNKSILIHEFNVAELDAHSLRDLYDRLDNLMREDGTEIVAVDPDRFGMVPEHSRSR